MNFDQENINEENKIWEYNDDDKKNEIDIDKNDSSDIDDSKSQIFSIVFVKMDLLLKQKIFTI